MKKIKSIKFNGISLRLDSSEILWYNLDPDLLAISIHNDFFTKHYKQNKKFIETCFEIEYEPGNFVLKVPDYQTLKSGYYITEFGQIKNLSGCDAILDVIYNLGNWFLTPAEAEEELNLRKTKMFVNKLIEWCNEQFNIGTSCKVEYANLGRYFYASHFNNSYYNQIIFNSKESANLFIKQIDLPENKTHRENFIEILKSGKL